MRKNEESLIGPCYNIKWITGWVLGLAAKRERCKENTGKKQGGGEMPVMLRMPLGISRGGICLAGTSLKSEKFQEEVVRTDMDSTVIVEAEGEVQERLRLHMQS